MTASTIGAGNLYGSNVSSNTRRTSSSVLINDEMMADFPEIKAYAESLQQKAFELLQGETLGAWGRPGHAMLHRQWAFEGMQAAVYKQGQVHAVFVRSMDCFRRLNVLLKSSPCSPPPKTQI